MKRCVLFFIVLVSTLVLAVVTDDDRPWFGEDVLVKHHMRTDMDVAGHRALPNPDN